MDSWKLLGLAALISLGSALSINVASSGGNITSSLQYGIMFEDINYSGDGGLYAELINNRAFQGSGLIPSTISPWTAINGAVLSLQNLSQPLSSALPTSLNVAVPESAGGVIGISNPGYWGISCKSQKYTGSFYVKGDYNGSFTASLQSSITNETFGTVDIESQATDSEWVQHNFTLNPSDAPNENNTFSITFDPAGVTGGSLDFNLISLFPPTYKNRPNGLRPDLMELLRGLKPSFLRLPGGNNLEGTTSPYRWKWNETLGPLETRPGRPGTWDYANTDGLGLVEYMHWCEDLDMEPILGVWDGLYLDGTVIPEDELQPYVQDALDEIEFLIGGTDTEYGALRAKLGYPDPWTLKYVEVGNEDQYSNGGSTYQAYRFLAFYNAIKAKYPDMVVFASAPNYSASFPNGSAQDFHQYSRPNVFANQFNIFDHYSTEHPTFVGEYAVYRANVGSDRLPFPIWIGTVGEAIFLLGVERNSPNLLGSAYAPLLQNLNSYQWAPDLISFTADPAKDVASTSYELIKLFSNTRTTDTLPTTTDGGYNPVYWVAGVNNDTRSHIFKAAVYNSTVNFNLTQVPISLTFDGVSAGASGELTVLTAPDPASYNNIGTDVVKSTVTEVTAGVNGTFSFDLPDLSIALFEVKATY